MNDEEQPMAPSQPATRGPRPCANCGALNELSFGSCIRCSAPLATDQKRPDIPRDFAEGGAQRPVRAPVDNDPWSGQKLFATKFFLGLTVLVFGGQIIAAVEKEAWGALFMGANIVDDVRYGAMLLNSKIDIVSPHVVLETEPWRVLSSVFVHFGTVHFGFNMLALVQLARLAEPAVGSARFAIAYVVSGIAGFLLTLLYFGQTGASTLTAGASGAIFGVMGLILGFLIRRRDPRWKTWAIQAVFYSLLFGVMLKANNAAHIGGLVAGAVFGVVFAPGAPKPAAAWQKVVAVISLVACVASLVLAQLSPLWREIQASLAG